MGPGKRFAPAIAVVALTLAVAAPSGVAATSSGEAADPARGGDARHGHPRGPAQLRVLHASPDAAAVDVQVRPIPDGEWSTVATDVGFGEASRYVRLDPGTHDVQLLAAGRDELVHVVADVVGDAGSTQTVNLIGLAGPRRGSGRACGRSSSRTEPTPIRLPRWPIRPPSWTPTWSAKRRSRTATSTAGSATPRSRSPCH